MDIPEPEMILLIGIPASGKSTFYRQRFTETHLQISLDILHSRAHEMEVLQAALAAGKSCVIDNTNVTAEERSRFIAPARNHAYRITGYYFRSVLAECLPRNAQRFGRERIPESGMKGRAEFADRCPWEKLESHDWVLILRFMPEAAAECPWKKIEYQDWIWLLQDRPEFAEHCLCWNEFSDSDWTFLQKTQPQLVKNYKRS